MKTLSVFVAVALLLGAALAAQTAAVHLDHMDAFRSAAEKEGSNDTLSRDSFKETLHSILAEQTDDEEDKEVYGEMAIDFVDQHKDKQNFTLSDIQNFIEANQINDFVANWGDNLGEIPGIISLTKV
eukprot:TRINITY_DN1098_c0_g1_i2.p1 TRINITY_DN1098_c0_g1~~TRINITY_DN1098_c0_g1_i2.p1  ORF type:complete len:127 (-),score=31.11 TRINITY_DN1098_c0_g1_i2:33-413(-)